ncbi:MAG: TRAP transporter large permease [Chloroflexi bacterium]|nr:TRAP transporter large permease [Chloroflexota bacterium]
MLIGTLAFVLVIIFVILGVPIAAAVGIAGFIGLLVLTGWTPAAGLVGMMPYSSTASYSLSVLPMFLLLGAFAYYGGSTEALFRIGHQVLGRLKAGLPIATVAACTAMAATSGSTLATATLMGKIAVPEMRKYGYTAKLATGLVSAAGTLATMIPPSISLVVYAILTEQPVGKMLLAGFLPGFFTAFLFVLYLIGYCRMREKPIMRKEAMRWGIFLEEKYALGVPVIVLAIMGSIYFGIATPTEAAAIGALAAFLLCAIARRMTLSRAQHAALETILSTSMIFTIIFASLIFARFLAYAGFPEGITKWILSLQVSRMVIFIGILGLYLLLGCFIDALGMMILTLPAVFPAVVALGFDPIWFGVIVVQMTEVGLITPPMGITVFGVASVVTDVSVMDIFRGAAPFLLIQAVNVTFLIIFPQIALFLPNAAW